MVDNVKEETKNINIAMPENERISDNELENIGKYEPLKDEIARMWSMRRMSDMFLVAEEIGALATNFENYIKEIRMDM